MDDYLDILKHELEADDLSFLIKMRIELEWDQSASSRVTQATQISAINTQKAIALNGGSQAGSTTSIGL